MVVVPSEVNPFSPKSLSCCVALFAEFCAALTCLATRFISSSPLLFNKFSPLTPKTADNCALTFNPKGILFNSCPICTATLLACSVVNIPEATAAESLDINASAAS